MNDKRHHGNWCDRRRQYCVHARSGHQCTAGTCIEEKKKKRRKPTPEEIRIISDAWQEFCLHHCPFDKAAECKDCPNRQHPYTFRSMIAEKLADTGVDPDIAAMMMGV